LEVTNVFTLSVLFVGESTTRHSPLARKVAAYGARCEFAPSYRKAHALLQYRSFDLILGDLRFADGWASRMVSLLVGSPVTYYCVLPADIGCWWLPLVKAGRECRDAPALRPDEFGRVLEGFFHQSSITPGSPRG
jgi:hypothetical protein